MPKTERLDFQTLSGNRVAVTKMHRSDDRLRDITHSHEIKAADFDLDAAIAWCEENGFTVLWWWDVDGRKCARAWKGEPWPVRRAWEITRMRERLNIEWMNQFRKNGRRPALDLLLSMDLAFVG